MNINVKGEPIECFLQSCETKKREQILMLIWYFTPFIILSIFFHEQLTLVYKVGTRNGGVQLLHGLVSYDLSKTASPCLLSYG